MAASYHAMLATALRLGGGDGASRVAAWRQIVDILAQGQGRIDGEARGEAFAALTALTGDVPVAQRRMASASLAGRITDAGLVGLFAGDVPMVAAPVLAQLVLPEDRWTSLLPTLPAASRNILRNRRDLPQAAVRLLGHFAAADLALPGERSPDAARTPPDAVAGESAPLPGTTPILDLVERIAQYRQRTPATGAPDDDARPPSASASFEFETDAGGTIVWVEGAPRLAIIGATLAHPAEPGGAGVDAAAAGAWRQRAPLGPCRLLIAGEGAAAGDWTIEAAPLFDPASGRFVGYRGEARRPRVGERADFRQQGNADRGTDSVRQLVHELRTPLNAIQGFAAMIDGQFLGPASSSQRAQASEIVADVARLVVLIDDLDLAARLDAGQALDPDRTGATPGSIGLMATVALAVDEQRASLAQRGVTLDLDAPPNEADRGAGEGGHPIVGRLLAAVAAVATSGEAIAVSVRSDARGAILRIARPGALRAPPPRRLLDPDGGLEGAWPDASLLGLGFTLRLCLRLAGEQGGLLTIAPDAFVLAFPTGHVHQTHIAR